MLGDEPNITRCWQNNGYHAFMAGPCFGKKEDAVTYRDKLIAADTTWWPQDKYLPDMRVLVEVGEGTE